MCRAWLDFSISFVFILFSAQEDEILVLFDWFRSPIATVDVLNVSK